MFASIKSKSCPIHHRTDCCGRKQKRKLEQKRGWSKVGPGIYRIDDPHHPRRYRERRSKSALHTLVDQKIVAQDAMCSICGKEFTDRREVGADHIDPRGADGAFRDDHPDNIAAAHNWCNAEKGSRRL